MQVIGAECPCRDRNYKAYYLPDILAPIYTFTNIVSELSSVT